jgi:hypothetical protein
MLAALKEPDPVRASQSSLFAVVKKIASAIPCFSTTPCLGVRIILVVPIGVSYQIP